MKDALVLEVSGSLKLFRGLGRIAAGLRDGCARMGFTALVAAAPTARGASWLAHAGDERLVTDPAALEAALAGLPVRVMTDDDATLEALAAIGATRVGDVTALPRAGVARRFDRQLLDDLDRALGRSPDPRSFFTPPAEFRARLELPAEVTQAEALLFAAKRLFVQLEGYLAARAGGVQRLALRLVHREARFTEVPIGLVAPARDAAHFTLLARERLGSLALPEAVRAIALDAGDVVPLAGEALALFDDGAAAPGDWTKLVERLRARLGGATVHCLAVTDDHRPERASRKSDAGLRAAGPAHFGLRPFWLLPAPLPLDEVGAIPQRSGPLRLLAGPERIESGWWDGGDVARDYFVAETADRAIVWVYRERPPGSGWFLHGLFA
jgi:protein ImuB